MDQHGQPHAVIIWLPAKHLPVRTEQEAVWAPELVWMDWRTEESFGLPSNQMWFLSRPTHSLVTTPTELPYAHVTIRDIVKRQTASLQVYELLPF
jgi:hypothetical protein